MRKLTLIIAVIMVGLILAACGGSDSSSGSAPAEIDAAKIYKATCVPCHGADRQGMPNLGSALTPETLSGSSDADVRDAIANGRPGTTMLGQSNTLKAAEIDALVQFVKHTSP